MFVRATRLPVFVRSIAVACSDDPRVMSDLADLGASFDLVVHPAIG